MSARPTPVSAAYLSLLAANASGLYHAVKFGRVRAADVQPLLEWLAFARHVQGYHEACGEEGITVPVAELAASARNAYLRTSPEPGTPLPFDALAAEERVGWETAARLVAWAVQEQPGDTGLAEATQQLLGSAERNLAGKGIVR